MHNQTTHSIDDTGHRSTISQYTKAIHSTSKHHDSVWDDVRAFRVPLGYAEVSRGVFRYEEAEDNIHLRMPGDTSLLSTHLHSVWTYGRAEAFDRRLL